MLIYVIISCPLPQETIIYICIYICICIYIIVFYFVFISLFIGVEQNLTNLIAFCLYVCSFVLCKFEVIQYILKYKCICISVLSYYTYSGTEYSDSLIVNNTSVLQCLFSCFFHLHLTWGVLLSTHRGLIPKLSTQ